MFPKPETSPLKTPLGDIKNGSGPVMPVLKKPELWPLSVPSSEAPVNELEKPDTLSPTFPKPEDPIPLLLNFRYPFYGTTASVAEQALG